ncbi:MAG: hypothetical protein CVV42_16875 [Candidatus Riflebacteria bacterium HGW-Riflebacteria-2]|jgi:hypothetical protein|nr:MAG: hypothetical protein CVV42_16875 [Candidatus Riflebacteria bacterium HGW-Riflebacteria-2]
MSNRKIRDKLYAVGLYLLFGVVLFLAMMGLKYVLIAICAYAGVQLVLDLFYITCGVRTKGSINGYQSSASKFYENDEYGFRRHPNVVAPPEPYSEPVLTGISYQARGRFDSEEKTYTQPVPFWCDSRKLGQEITLFYLAREPQKARHISIGWFLFHAVLPGLAIYIWLTAG